MSGKKFKVAVTDTTYPLGPEFEILKELATVESITNKTGHDLAFALSDVHGVIVNLSTKMNAKVIDEMRNCKILVRNSVGYDNVDLEAASKKGIYVCNIPDYCVEEVADQTIGLLLALTRKLCYLNNNVKSGKWGWHAAVPVRRLRNCTLGIIGLGRIGTAVALRAKPIGFNIIVNDPYMQSGKDRSTGVKSVDFDVLLRESDIICCHVPLSQETRHMIDESSINKMKKGVFIINTSRGEVVDTNSLIEGLKSGKIAGAALDVLEKEPPDMANPLMKMDQVILTPHSSHLSTEGQEDRQVKSAEEIVRVLQGKPPRNPVNLELIAKYRH